MLHRCIRALNVIIKNNSKQIVWSAIIIVLLFFLLNRVTVIQLEVNDQTYYINDNKFEIRWIHSVEKEEWVEVYEINHDELVLTETYFKTFGAGVPAQGEIISSSDGYVHMKVNTKFSELNIAVSQNVKTTLLTKDREVSLYELTEDYNNVSVSVAHLRIWQYWKGEFL